MSVYYTSEYECSIGAIGGQMTGCRVTQTDAIICHPSIPLLPTRLESSDTGSTLTGMLSFVADLVENILKLKDLLGTTPEADWPRIS